MSLRPLTNRFVRLLIALCVFALCLPTFAQENYFVGTTAGVLSLYDLTTNSLSTTIKGIGASSILPGPNNRLAFAPKGVYLSVVDTTIQRELARLADVNGDVAAVTSDGKLLLVPGEDGWLRVVDTAQLKVVRTINLTSIVGTSFYGGIVVAAKKAFLFPSLGPIVVVDLASYSISYISIPSGQFDQSKLFAVTPDGKTIVAIEEEYSDYVEHVLLVNALTNTIIADYPQDSLYGAYSLAVTPNGSDSSKILGYISGSDDIGNVVVMLDLRPNSPTYGQVLLSTSIRPWLSFMDVAVNSDGSRLIVAGSPVVPPNNNTFVIDTGKMLTDPADAVIAQLMVNGGGPAYATCTGFFSTTPPGTAPIVSGVSGNITNDADHQITITGGNFQPGAQVRLGSMQPLAATFMGSGELTVTVPANAPAGKNIDIVVTNPETNMSQDQQNQSGLLANRFNILLNPKFQPSAQFGVVNNDSSFSVYDLIQRQMINAQQTPVADYVAWPDFNSDGKQLYLATSITIFNNLERAALPVDLSTNTLGSAIVISGSHQLSSDNLSASIDPSTGEPVVNAVTRGSTDLSVSVIDSNAGSPTFNTIIRTFDSGGLASGGFPYEIATTPDGKFAYIWYRSGNPSSYFLGVMNMSTGAFTHVSAASLRINQDNSLNGIKPVISPDGKSLLLSSIYGNRRHIEVIDISNPAAPKRIAEITPVPVPGYGFPTVANYQVIGDLLYAFDQNGIIVVFNFRKDIGDFRERGWYIYPNLKLSDNLLYEAVPNIALSADGAWLYVADPANDLIAVLDPTKLTSGKDVVITTIRAPYYPYRLAVSPVPPPARAALHQAPATRRVGRVPARIQQQ